MKHQQTLQAVAQEVARASNRHVQKLLRTRVITSRESDMHDINALVGRDDAAFTWETLGLAQIGQHSTHIGLRAGTRALSARERKDRIETLGGEEAYRRWLDGSHNIDEDQILERLLELWDKPPLVQHMRHVAARWIMVGEEWSTFEVELRERLRGENEATIRIQDAKDWIEAQTRLEAENGIGQDALKPEAVRRIAHAIRSGADTDRLIRIGYDAAVICHDGDPAKTLPATRMRHGRATGIKGLVVAMNRDLAKQIEERDRARDWTDETTYHKVFRLVTGIACGTPEHEWLFSPEWIGGQPSHQDTAQRLDRLAEANGVPAGTGREEWIVELAYDRRQHATVRVEHDGEDPGAILAQAIEKANMQDTWKEGDGSTAIFVESVRRTSGDQARIEIPKQYREDTARS